MSSFDGFFTITSLLLESFFNEDDVWVLRVNHMT